MENRQYKQVIAFLILQLFIVFYSFGQDSFGGISGKVVDEKGEVFTFVTISLLNSSDSSLIMGTYTDETGAFSLSEIPNGKYILTASFIGYTNLYKPLSIKKETKLQDIGTLKFETSGVALNGVVVTSRRPVIIKKVDRLIFDVKNSVSLTGGTAWETVQKTPGVQTDFSGNVFLNGSSATVIIDGKPTNLSQEELVSLLSSMSTENISRIEVFTNPPAKFDAQGGPIINIISLKNNEIGLSAKVRSSFKQGRDASGSIGGNVAYKNKNLNAYGNYSYRNSNYITNEQENIVYTNQLAEHSNWGLSHNRKYNPVSQVFKIGADLDIDKDHVIGFQFNGFDKKSNKVQTSNTQVANDLMAIDSTIDTDNNSINSSNQYSFNLNYKGVFDSLGRSLNADIDYTSYRSNRTQELLTNTFNNGFTHIQESQSQSVQKINIQSAKIDYNHPFKSGLKLETGAKISFIETDNDLAFQNIFNQEPVNDETKSNHFIYTENSQAVYASLSKDIKRLSLKVGLRGEYTQTKGDSRTLDSIINVDYLKLFPTFYAQYVFGENLIVSSSFGKRVNRPEYWRLNPFQSYTSPYTFSEGNPFLKPSYLNIAELTFIIKRRFIVSAFYVVIRDNITQISQQDNNTNTLKFTQVNLDKSGDYGVGIVLPFQITPWWDINNYMQFSQRQEKSSYLEGEFDFSTWAAYGSITNTFKISKKHNISAELTAWYQSATIQGIFESESRYDVSFGIRKSFWDKKAYLALNVSDVFYTNPYKVSVNYEDQKYDFFDNLDSRLVRLSFSYKFGSKKAVKIRKRVMGNDDEQKRLKG